MDFQRQDELRRVITDAKKVISAAQQELALMEADDWWDDGNRGMAIVRLRNHGVSRDDLVRYCRVRGLSRNDANEVIDTAPLDRI